MKRLIRLTLFVGIMSTLVVNPISAEKDWGDHGAECGYFASSKQSEFGTCRMIAVDGYKIRSPRTFKAPGPIFVTIAVYNMIPTGFRIHAERIDDTTFPPRAVGLACTAGGEVEDRNYCGGFRLELAGDYVLRLSSFDGLMYDSILFTVLDN